MTETNGLIRPEILFTEVYLTELEQIKIDSHQTSLVKIYLMAEQRKKYPFQNFAKSTISAITFFCSFLCKSTFVHKQDLQRKIYLIF